MSLDPPGSIRISDELVIYELQVVPIYSPGFDDPT